MINKNIVIQWQQANMPENSLAYQDLEEMQELALHNAESEKEAVKLVMLAIRSAAKNGATSTLSVQRRLEKWINAGATTAAKVGDYEKQSQQLLQPRQRFGQPLQNESPIEKFTPEQIDQQNQCMAKELGYASVEDMANGTADKLSELRRTRAERLADQSANGRTANGRRVLQRF
ncbi:hypothetical protein [Weissella confusa]|uniref:hypothetical protein n=1 Tax=Weissella confusa TaxID=1583 RepID=UPI00189FA9CC|nr:hypothetical protein [Weissella confusa]MBF7058588.1 hypothetical protein [Weissella confusa]MBJ7686096.1 hypothetical protein [Weissella confusa]MBJ7696375.1 hypothetical protein [Weissella confusa]